MAEGSCPPSPGMGCRSPWGKPGRTMEPAVGVPGCDVLAGADNGILGPICAEPGDCGVEGWLDCAWGVRGAWRLEAGGVGVGVLGELDVLLAAADATGPTF